MKTHKKRSRKYRLQKKTRGVASQIDLKIEEIRFRKNSRVRILYRGVNAKSWRRLGTIMNVSLRQSFIVNRPTLIEKIAGIFQKG